MTGVACRHPKAKANGGAGLRVSLSGLNAIVCGHGGCHTPLKEALDCEGQHLAGEETA
jgi:hypothetical protein